MAQINRNPSKTQVKDAYDILYRQMLRQERMGNMDAAKIIGTAIKKIDNKSSVQEEKCIMATQIGIDGSLRQRWLKTSNISRMEKTSNGTMIYFYDDNTMLVRESVQEIIMKVKERIGQK